ncbi:MAG: hypothetical protein GY884_24165 [Proteobacteria bacterium]|nr:hypothetical protein [Pseudomonadota bacterium]
MQDSLVEELSPNPSASVSAYQVNQGATSASRSSQSVLSSTYPLGCSHEARVQVPPYPSASASRYQTVSRFSSASVLSSSSSTYPLVS